MAGLATLIYGAAALYAAVSMLRGHRYLRSVIFIVISLGWAVQTVALFERGYEIKACPIGNPFEIFQFITWTSVGLYLLLVPFYRLSLLGFFTTLLVFGLNTLSLVMPGWDQPYTGPRFGGNPWIELHASLAILSYGIFGVLALIALMYLLQQYGLKQKRSQGLFRWLPSIRELDAVGLHLLSAGLLVLSVALVVGSFYWIPNLDSVSIFKLSVTLLIWAGYLLAFCFRFQKRLVARKFAWACLLLFGLALISLWPVNASRRPLPPETPLTSHSLETHDE